MRQVKVAQLRCQEAQQEARDQRAAAEQLHCQEAQAQEAHTRAKSELREQRCTHERQLNDAVERTRASTEATAEARHRDATEHLEQRAEYRLALGSGSPSRVKGAANSARHQFKRGRKRVTYLTYTTRSPNLFVVLAVPRPARSSIRCPLWLKSWVASFLPLFCPVALPFVRLKVSRSNVVPEHFRFA